MKKIIFMTLCAICLFSSLALAKESRPLNIDPIGKEGNAALYCVNGYQFLIISSGGGDKPEFDVKTPAQFFEINATTGLMAPKTCENKETKKD